MIKKFPMFLIICCVLFFLVGCASLDDVSSEDAQTNSPDIFANYTQTDLFKFSYDEANTVWKRSEGVSFKVAQEYMGEETYPYKGSSSMHIDICVFFNSDGSHICTEESFVLSPTIFYSTDDIQYGIEPGDVDYRIGGIKIPEDAPLGKYHLILSFENYYQFFENAIEIVE